MLTYNRILRGYVDDCLVEVDVTILNGTPDSTYTGISDVNGEGYGDASYHSHCHHCHFICAALWCRKTPNHPSLWFEPRISKLETWWSRAWRQTGWYNYQCSTLWMTNKYKYIRTQIHIYTLYLKYIDQNVMVTHFDTHLLWNWLQWNSWRLFQTYREMKSIPLHLRSLQHQLLILYIYI